MSYISTIIIMSFQLTGLVFVPQTSTSTVSAFALATTTTKTTTTRAAPDNTGCHQVTRRPRRMNNDDITSGSRYATTTTTTTSLCGHSDNIRAAMEASERYGIHSPEAKLAWEVVEEYDGRDNSAAYEPNYDRMMSDEQRAEAFQELQYTLDVLKRQQPRTFAHNPNLMQDIAAELQSIKLAPPSKKPSPKIPGLWDAKLKARAMSQQYGNGSIEAKLAWEEVEELASAGLDNAVGSTTYETCDLGQAAEACLALEELDRFLYFEHQYNNVDSNDPLDVNRGRDVNGRDDSYDYDDRGRYDRYDRRGDDNFIIQDSGGSSNYVGRYHDNIDENGDYRNYNYIDEIDDGGNYQGWDHQYDDDGRGLNRDSTGSNFYDRRSGGYTSYNKDTY